MKMYQVQYETIGPEEEGQRLDNYLIRILKGVPKSHIYRIVRAGEVRVNKKRIKPDYRLKSGDYVRIPPVRMAESQPVFVGANLAKKLTENIIHEDAQFLVVNKPAGVAVHGGSGLDLGVIEAFRKMRPDLHYLELAHRLDRETSGCLIMVKKKSALRALHALFNERLVTKTYWALLSGSWKGKKNVLVDQALEKNTLKSGERIVKISETGKSSETLFTLLENFPEVSLAEIFPKTGRTHQIRVHSAWLGHPVLGDEKYGKEMGVTSDFQSEKRLYLHARSVQFTLNAITYTFQAELDATFELTLKQLRARSVLHNE